jgi:drug/metabolite transporter (DMT)-like permease
LPLALAGFAAYGVVNRASGAGFAFPLGPRPALFVGLMLLIGLTASWLGTLLWNQASRRLPTALAGQLMVFETLFALAYAFLLRQALPGVAVMSGIVFLCSGVLLGVRALRHQTH